MKKIKWGVMLAVGMVMLGLALAREQSVRAFCSPHMCEPENVLAGCNTGEKCVAYCCIEPTPGPSAGGGGGGGGCPAGKTWVYTYGCDRKVDGCTAGSYKCTGSGCAKCKATEGQCLPSLGLISDCKIDSIAQLV